MPGPSPTAIKLQHSGASRPIPVVRRRLRRSAGKSSGAIGTCYFEREGTGRVSATRTKRRLPTKIREGPLFHGSLGCEPSMNGMSSPALPARASQQSVESQNGLEAVQRTRNCSMICRLTQRLQKRTSATHCVRLYSQQPVESVDSGPSMISRSALAHGLRQETGR